MNVDIIRSNIDSLKTQKIESPMWYVLNTNKHLDEN